MTVSADTSYHFILQKIKETKEIQEIFNEDSFINSR